MVKKDPTFNFKKAKQKHLPIAPALLRIHPFASFFVAGPWTAKENCQPEPSSGDIH